MTATEVFESVSNGGVSDFSALVDVLNQHGRWCLVGGLAVNCYVEPVYTIDADIVVVAERLPQVRDELAAAGFVFQQFAHSLNAQRAQSKLNVQFRTDPRYQEFLANREEHEVLGLTVPVANLGDIIRGKVWAWQDSERRVSKRKKDELDLIRIAEARADLRHLIPAEITRQLG